MLLSIKDLNDLPSHYLHRSVMFQPIGSMYAIYGNFTINIPQMLAYIPYMDPMGNTSQVHVLRLRPLPPAPRRPLAPRRRAGRLPPRHRDAAQRPAADAGRAGGEAAAEGRGGCEAAAVDGDVA